MRYVGRLIGLDQQPHRNIWSKFERSPFYDPKKSLQQKVSQIQKLLDECFLQRKRTNLSKWREAMHDDVKAFSLAKERPSGADTCGQAPP